jgi:hypothetical protein
MTVSFVISSLFKNEYTTMLKTVKTERKGSKEETNERFKIEIFHASFVVLLVESNVTESRLIVSTLFVTISFPFCDTIRM